MLGGDRILAAGPLPGIKIPAGVATIDVQGGTILPGFINAHVHTAYNETLLKTWAQSGVTTVRDLGAFVHYSDELFRKRDVLCAVPECARLTAVGNFINVTGGYPEAFWDGYILSADSPAEARQQVNRLIDTCADAIKTAMESGYVFRKEGWPLLTPETAKALVETAYARGKPVTAHVTSFRDLERALDAGVDEIARMMVDDLPQRIAGRMVAAGILWVPTLELWQRLSSAHSVPYGETAIRNLTLFVKAGGQIALGTDYAGASSVCFDLGMPMREIQWMHKAGISAMQIIVAATKNAARACNMQKQLGTLEAGKLADVLVLFRNPEGARVRLCHLTLCDIVSTFIIMRE